MTVLPSTQLHARPVLVEDEVAPSVEEMLDRLLAVEGLWQDVRMERRLGIAPSMSVATASIPGTFCRRDGQWLQLPWEAGGTGRANRPHVGGGGAHADDELALLCAMVEAAERYAMSLNDMENAVVATADELGDEAIDLQRIARCSERELAQPGCAVFAPRADVPIHWQRAIELRSGAERYVPAVMVHLLAYAPREERFWLPISTGCAAHSSLPAAVLGGLLELCERDSIAIGWEQRIPFPRLHPSLVPDETQELIEWYGDRFVELRLFDATTDLGVPTVYVVALADHSRVLTQCVSCASALDLPSAAARAVKEIAMGRWSLEAMALTAPPMALEDFSEAHDGALHMGRPDKRAAFGHLLQVPEAIAPRPRPPIHGLEHLVDELGDAGIDCYVVDITPDDIAATGLRVVRTVAPGLQPMSVIPSARFRGHPRLYEAPRAMGYTVHTEDRLNPEPQPFP